MKLIPQIHVFVIEFQFKILLAILENHKMIVENSGLLTVAALKHLNVKDKRVVSILSGGNMDVIPYSLYIIP